MDYSLRYWIFVWPDWEASGGLRDIAFTAQDKDDIFDIMLKHQDHVGMSDLINNLNSDDEDDNYSLEIYDSKDYTRYQFGCKVGGNPYYDFSHETIEEFIERFKNKSGGKRYELI